MIQECLRDFSYNSGKWTAPKIAQKLAQKLGTQNITRATILQTEKGVEEMEGVCLRDENEQKKKGN